MVVGAHVVFGPGVRVASGAEIRAFSHLEGCSGRAEGRDRPLCPACGPAPRWDVESAHVGNFVELKATRLGRWGQGEPFELSGR